MQRWFGKIAVVTGASSGIGAATAGKLVENGIQVVGLARRLEKLNELGQRLTGKPGKFIPYQADMTKKEDILEAFKWIDSNVGPVSVLVNNAGVARNTTLINGDIDAWKDILDTNVLGLAISTRQAIESMRANNIDGHIININSVTGHVIADIPNQNMYSPSKFAVTAFTEVLRKELVALDSKIKVTSLSPGLVETEIFSAAELNKLPKILKMIAQSPSLTSHDIADSILYILATPPHVQITEMTVKPVGEIV